MTISNCNYQSVAEPHKQLQDLAIGDEVLIRVHPERFPLGTLKKLQTRRRGSYKILRRFDFNAYKLDIPHDLGISSVFNVDNMTCYHTSIFPMILRLAQCSTSII